jgi:choline kinase
MEALILAAGRGSRLGALTADRPKALIDLGGTSALGLQLDLLLARKVQRVVVVTGYSRGMVQRFVEEHVADRAEVINVWNPFWRGTNVIGSAWMASAHLRDSFVYLHADTVFEPSILDDLLSSEADAVLAVDVRPGEPEQMKADVRDGIVAELSKDLPPERTHGEFIGIGLFRAPAIQPIRSGMDAVLERGETSAYFEAAINDAIQHGLGVRIVPTSGRPWTEIDFPEDLALAREILPQIWPEPRR